MSPVNSTPSPSPAPPLIPVHLGAETLAVVPACALSWHRVQLPAGIRAKSPRLRAVLEGLLEDQLLDEPATLHFALEPNAPYDAPIWVAVCSRQWLQDALAAFTAHGTAPQRLVPEWAPGPGNTARWVTGNADAARLTWVDAQGVHTWPLSQHTAHIDIPADVALWAEPAVAQTAERLFHRQANVVTTEQRLADAAQTEWDLAQFDMVRRSPWAARVSEAASTVLHAPQWRAARWAAVALLLVQVVGLNAYAWRAQATLAAQRTAIRQTLTTTFPEITVVVDAPLQMERALATLRQSSGGASPRDMEVLLSNLGSNSTATPVERAPAAINFEAGELRVTPGSTP